jgi:hypothetical protein
MLRADEACPEVPFMQLLLYNRWAVEVISQVS